MVQPKTHRKVEALKKGGRLIVLGSGESGTGAALLGKQKGYEVFVSDKGAIAPEYKKLLEDAGIPWEEGQHTEARVLKADLCVKSPGIPDTVPLVQALVAQGTPVISEIEFASWFCDATLVAITGSNGKTTTTLLTHHLLTQGGLQAGLAGNIGNSFARMVAEDPHPVYVLEVSSFQLDGIMAFRPHIGVITNITPDHLDRYGYQMERYIQAKLRLAENQTGADHLIYDLDDPVLSENLHPAELAPKCWACSLEQPLPEGAWLEGQHLAIKTNQTENDTLLMSTESLALQGRHNVKNTMAAATVARLLGIRKETIRQSVANFQGAPHRLEPVLKIHHVQYINDSKATNVNATYFALESMKAPTIWIVGGVDKGNDYSALMPLVREKVKAIICLGVDNTPIVEAFGRAVDLLVETVAMSEAVKVAYKIAERGDTVLLSPACASFDLFENYEDRGNQFKAAVKAL
ncbi:UDP-N-acetylmuramoyl-L-alanine--D-glutamate ligase [Robiginitalea sp. M366]|uniref:UDP-N-acetylmuramoyl-L-alanine--D-glutamate ligase n=1 Tax=Robiginitalea aestuariiviva TaxID=3036903 RepID=UPI00240DE81B|nr:UDP-N-acetylmuramoyl-L-alanine--D-glutamate ligase [Robiginitalea aestuariiviva]MDG1570860.1 UDP-N-acetylmuramoyl-L-alanine--D-glutamate ligase [Robiginitalea aestuariiviva]